MEQKIEIPTEEDMLYASKMLAYAGSLAIKFTNKALTGTQDDLATLQTLLDCENVLNEGQVAFQALGIAFGMVLISRDPSYDWWIVEDDEGRNFCVRYKESALLVFPQTVFSRRIDEGEDFSVEEVFTTLMKQLDDAIASLFEKSCA